MLQAIWRSETFDDRPGYDSFRHFLNASQGIGAAGGVTENIKFVEAKMVGRLRHIVGPINQCAIGYRVGKAVCRSIG